MGKGRMIRVGRVCKCCLYVFSLACAVQLCGCEPKPARPPTSPQPPRPQVAPDGYPRSLLGNATLSSALLSYKVQCNRHGASIRICKIQREAAQHPDAGDT